MADWQAIKTEYITTQTSYRKLAQKYGIHFKVISERGKDEGWVELRTQYQDKTLTDALNKISKQEASRAAKIYSVADKLLLKIEAMAESGNPLDAKCIRALTAAVRDLKEIQNVRSELDRQEQEARIANLRKQTAGNGDDDDDETGVIILPPVMGVDSDG